MAELITDAPVVAAGAAAAGKKAPANQSVPLADVLFLTLRKWPWIVLSLAACLGLATLYVLRTPTMYTRSADIMIKDTSKGKSAGMEDFADFGLVSAKTDIEDEIINLRSGELMAEVVRRLGLDTDYYRPGRFHREVAYGADLPMSVEIVDIPADASACMSLEVGEDGTATLSRLVSNGRDIDGQFRGALGDSIATPMGHVVVKPTAAYAGGGGVELRVEKTPLEAAQAAYSSRLTVAQNGDKSSMIHLALTDRSIQRADDVLSMLIAVYKDFWIRDRNEISVSTSMFINDRLGVIEGELGNVDDDISSFKSQHLIPDIAAASAMYMSQNEEYSTEILDLNDQIQLARFVRSYLTDEASRNELLPANPGLAGDIAPQVGEYNERLMQRNQLAAKSSENNPLVRGLDAELASMRNAIVTTVDNQITALQTRLQSLRSTKTATASKLATSPSQAKYLLSVERQQKVKEALYLFLLQKREENELSQAFTAYNTKIVNRPGPAGVPPTPARGVILLAAALAGLAVPFGAVYLREMGNTRVRGRKDIGHLSVPFLGEIPQQDAEGRRKKGGGDNGPVGPVVAEGRRDVINEAFRVLRTNVEFMRGQGDGASVVAVTSFNPGSGKSFISVNLATAMALKGKRVLVIDGDMRHGSASAYVGSPAEGLANYLAGGTDDARRLIVGLAGDQRLGVLPVGPVPPNPTELLESPRFAALIASLRPDYDYIFIDCPPVEVVADAQIIDAHADRTIFVVRAGLLERAMLPELERLYGERKYRSMALILNGTPQPQSRYGHSHGYRYGYGYGYAYGYNYGNGNNKKEK